MGTKTTPREAATRIAALLAEFLDGHVTMEALPLRLHALGDEIAADGSFRLTPPEPDDVDAIWRRIFDHWRAMFGKGKAKPTAGRRSKVLARLREGYTERQILTAIAGCNASDFHRDGGHVDLTLICRSGEKLEEFIERAPQDAEEPIPDMNNEADRLVRAMRIARDEGRMEDYERLNEQLASVR